MIQYQQLIAKYINVNNLGIGQFRSSINQSQYGFNYQHREYYEAVHFPSNVPKSYLIYGAYQKESHLLIEDMDIHCNEQEFIEKLKMIVWTLWGKYISTDAPFQINIPFT